jgi:arginine/ornithine N-succinyltransferase beta subunit
MTNRSLTGRNAHCKGIYREAIILKQDGWYVMADHIPGFDKPPEIEGYIPDIYAVKASCTYIIEVETGSEDDREQHAALRNYARQFSKIRFFVRVVDTAGRRVYPDNNVLAVI